MSKIIFGDILYIKGRIGWQALKKEEFLDKGDYYLVTGIDITDEYRIDFNKCYFVNKERYEMDDKIQLKEGDIIVTKDGTIGKIAIVDKLDKPATLNSHLFLIRNLREDILDTQFLFYLFRSNLFQKYAQNNTSGSNIPAFTQKKISEFEFNLPAIDVQRNIARTLKVIDDKIICNNAVNTEFESMAKTIYDYWFLQFEFPNEEGKPYNSAGGKMLWNKELRREIPAGWKVVDILELCDVVDCLHSKKPEYYYESEDSYMLILDNLLPNGLIDLRSKYYISKQDYDEWTSRITVSEGDFVITNAGRAGDIGRIPNGVKCAIGRNLTAIRPVKIDSFYLRMYFHSGYVKQQIRTNLDAGAFFMSFNVKSIKKLKVLVPQEDVLEKAVKIFGDIIQKIEMLNNENQELASVRDFLLPLLMSGQVGFK